MNRSHTAQAGAMPAAYSFAGFRLEADGRLLRGELLVELCEEESALLRMLLERAGEIVSLTELKGFLSGDVPVSDEHAVELIESLRSRFEPVDCIQSAGEQGYRIPTAIQTDKLQQPDSLPRLAILPFVIGYDTPGYLGRAITEQLITRLNQLPDAAVSIVPKFSVYTLVRRAVSASEIGKALGADLVLTGKLYTIPGSNRVQAEMIRGTDGKPLWKEDFLVEHGEIAKLVATLADRIVLRLQGNGSCMMAVAAQETEDRSAPAQREAYEIYLKAHCDWQTTERHRMHDSMGRLLHAIELDPFLMDARIDLAQLSTLQAIFGSMPPRLAADMVQQIARPTPDDEICDPGLLPALGWVSFYVERDLDKALRAFERSAHLPYDLWLTQIRATFASSLCHFDEAAELLRDAIRIDPYSSWLQAKLAWISHLAGDSAASVKQFRRLMEQFPDNDTTNLYAVLILSYNGEADSVLERTRAIAERMPEYDFAASSYAYVLACAGHVEESLGILERLHWFSSERFVLNTFNAAAYAALGLSEAAIGELQIANENRCPWFFLMLADPRLKPLHGHPEFEALRSILPAMKASVKKSTPPEISFSDLEELD